MDQTTSTQSHIEQPTKAVDMVIAPIGELVTSAVANKPARGEQLRDIRRIRNAAIAISDGKIAYVGPESELTSHVKVSDQTVTIDGSNKLVSPGLVDPHTHTVFSGNRANEFAMRCQGKTYAEIANAGGGIVASMRATQNASREELRSLAAKRLERMLVHGSTTVEIKTGYGLSSESELNMLECIYDLAEDSRWSIVPTFMPAHAVPPGTPREQYVNQIVEEMLPRAKRIHDARRSPAIKDLFVDVFCDKGYFTLDDTRRIFDAARKLGLSLKVHSDEFENLGATSLAAEYGANSTDHVLNINDADIEKMRQSDTVAVLLPGTSFYLNLKEHAPARKLIDGGVAVALGSDFNPGSCHIFSLPMIMGLACMHLKMLPEEALTALTLNAACALGLGSERGILREGYRADITIYDVATLEEIPYNVGWNPVASVIKDGVIVVADKNI